jgi:light-regulated signal transduction histidine kinase (bacteriophytochrome)
MERAVYIRNEDGEVVRAVGATTDLTHRHKYEESLKQLNSELEHNLRQLALSNQDLEQFAYITSHDLQEPLRMVSSFMTLLEKKYASQLDDKALQYIHFATDGAKKMRQIILDLLDFSKVGKYDEQLTCVPLNDVVSESLALFRRLVSEKKAVVNVGKLPTVTYYRTPITQIVQNLLSNALKYGKPDVSPQVDVFAIDHANEHEIVIADNGIGISAEYYDKIFVIFQRLNPELEFTGTGIGLSIVKKILDRMGGRIWVESEEGVGSAFHFTIPKMQHRD